MKIGLIGNGFVGNAIYKTMGSFYDFSVYDIESDRRYNSFKEVDNTEIIFICVPTPMNREDGKFDLSILADSIENLSPVCTQIK